MRSPSILIPSIPIPSGRLPGRRSQLGQAGPALRPRPGGWRRGGWWQPRGEPLREFSRRPPGYWRQLRQSRGDSWQSLREKSQHPLPGRSLRSAVQPSQPSQPPGQQGRPGGGGARAMLGVEQPASEASPKEASVAASQRWRWGCSNRLQVGMGITGKQRVADAGQLRGLNGCSKTTQGQRGRAPETADSEGFIGSTDHSGFANWGNCGFDDWGALPLPQQRRYNCVGKLASIVDPILYIRIICPDCGGQT